MPTGNDYAQWRRHLIRLWLDRLAKSFADRYDPHRPTIIVLPGGMGSSLGRSTQPVDAFHPSGKPEPVIATLWADLGIILLGRALSLEIAGAGEHDLDDHIIVPTGALDFLFRAYDGTEAWARNSQLNYAVFPYDWRRTIVEAASHFVYFLGRLQKHVGRAGHPDPLPKATLLCHSMGGLVARMAIATRPTLLDTVQAAVFVAVPFYGTWSNFHRCYDGEEMLSLLYGARTTARIIGSLPGPYILNYLDHALWRRDGAALGLGGRYPFFDRATGAACDPHDPANRGRLPPAMAFSRLDVARQHRAKLMSPMPTSIADKVHFIYGDAAGTTPIEMSWDPLPAGYDPRIHPLPVHTETLGPGDGTVPAWAAVPAEFRAPARHAQLLAVPFEHLSAAEDSRVLDHIGALVAPDSYAPVTPVTGGIIYGRTVEPDRDRDRLRAFLGDARDHRIGATDPRRTDAALLRGTMEAITPC